MFGTPFHFQNHFAGVAKAPSLASSARAGTDGLRGTMKSLLGVLVLLGCVGTSFGDSLPGKLKIITERDGELTRVLLKNGDTIDMTSTIEIAAENMQSSVPLPCTLTVPAGKTV